MKTGVFFHPGFKGKEWIIIGDKFRHFPEVIQPALDHPYVTLFSSEKVDEELLLQIHTPRFVENLKGAWYCEGALRSVGGCVAATEKILAGEIVNALVFTVAAGHHAERDSAWGGTYASCAGPAFYHARRKFGPKKFAIVDTDCHHGNGTRDVFCDDEGVLHVCFCSMDRIQGNGTKICVDAGWHTTDDDYLNMVRDSFIPRAKAFQPDLILHNFGHDTCRGDYGDLGLTPEFFPRLAMEIRDCAREICGGRYLVLTHGGNRVEVADYIFPEILRVLSAED